QYRGNIKIDIADNSAKNGEQKNGGYADIHCADVGDMGFDLNNLIKAAAEKGGKNHDSNKGRNAEKQQILNLYPVGEEDHQRRDISSDQGDAAGIDGEHHQYRELDGFVDTQLQR